MYCKWHPLYEAVPAAVTPQIVCPVCIGSKGLSTVGNARKSSSQLIRSPVGTRKQGQAAHARGAPVRAWMRHGGD
ncbi:hypothetical protein HYQ46_009552 [Verticillium longisporum]|nr:hypothetical protein HYQ46_009552 [Verticillium longisporum]